MADEWKLWKAPPKRGSDSVLLRYGLAILLSLFAVFLSLRVPGLMEAPDFMLFGAVVLSAFYGGVGPSLLTLALCLAAVICLFLRPIVPFSLADKLDFGEGLRLAAFVWVSITISLLIAGLRRSRANLRESEERYRILVQTAPDAIAIVNEMGLIIFVSPAAGKLFQCPSEQMLGLPFSLFVPGFFCQSHLGQLKNNLDTRKTATVADFTGRNLHGEIIPLETTFTAFGTNGENVFSVFMRDARRREAKNQLAA